jgi:hypothetical protein
VGRGQTHHINDCTILSSSDATRHANDDTGHGIFVSIDNVYSL